MRLQDLGFLGSGYAPWGAGTPGVTNPGATNAAAGASAGGSASTDVSGSPNDDGAFSGTISPSSIAATLSSALSNSPTGSAAELAVVRESETLKIQLTDGSQVTLRVRAQGAAFAAVQTQADGSSSSTAAIFASGQLQVAVDGNLSSADMQAIGDVVSQVNSLATQFFSGDVQDAFAAAASLNIDPAEIAGFSMKLSYSSTLIQQASAGANTTSSAPGASDASPSGTPATASPSTSAPATGSPDSSTASTSQAAANSASPQQIIINFIQTAMAKLGRGSVDSPSHLRVSSRWKLHLLAQALPLYTQATAVQGATPVAAATPQVASNRYPTLQAARLAADTLSQLAQ